MKNLKNTIVYWTVNTFTIITSALLLFFATIGVIANFDLPEKIYIFKIIPIMPFIFIFIVFTIALYISVRAIWSNAKTELILEILKEKEKYDNNK